MDYLDGRFSFRSLYFSTALTQRRAIFRRKRISDGCNDNPKGFPFKRGPSFSRISNGLSKGLWHTLPTLSLEPPSQLFLYHANRKVTGYLLFYAVTVSCRASLLYPNYLSVFLWDLLWYLFRNPNLLVAGYNVRGRIQSFGFVLSIFR